MSSDEYSTLAVLKDGNVVPLHTVGTIKRPPGRPRNVIRKPTSDDLEYHARIAVEREEFVKNHLLVRHNEVKGSGHTAADKLNLLKYYIARETAVLEFNRVEMEKRGVDTSQNSSRIIASMKQIADIELDIKKLGHTVIDPTSEEVQKIFKFWLGCLKTVISELVEGKAMDSQTMDLFFNKFSSAMDGWEDKVGLD
jgi:hypothetical protein